jgi:outer membrane receptor protein involved in Fe transport
VEYLPTVSYTSNGPGYGILYMRGISSGGDGVHSGSMPSVAVYLDEQPVTTINQILDVHIYDMARIEVLPGPQGTLFGQGSQAGTLRIITNKPDPDGFASRYDVGVDTVQDGEMGYSVEGMVNLPLGDRTALRLVGWHETDGGYVDYVPGTVTYAASGITIDNANLVGEDINERSKTGARAALRIDLNENWSLTPGLMYQQGEADGVWQVDPDMAGDLEVVRFFEDTYDDDWLQATLTVEGDIGDSMSLVYAGSYLDRELVGKYDYSEYSEYIENLYAYYGYACYHYDAQGGCADPSQYVDSDETFERFSHEIRLQSNSDSPLRWIVGAFYQEQEHDFNLQWVVPDMDPANSVIENGVTTWQTYQIRTDQDDAFFGELSYDFSDRWSATVGARWFSYDNELYGFNGFLGHCTGFYDANGNFVEDRVNGTPQYPCFDTRILDETTDGDDTSYKGNVNFQATDDVMFYATYSEGFRSGGVNRARVPDIETYRPDWVYNHEIGWKSTLADGRVRFNGAVYMLDWEDFQFGILDFSISNLTIIRNVGDAETVGAEFDLTWAATDNFMLTMAGSYNQSELQTDFWLIEDDRVDGLPPDAPTGTEMPYVPEFQWTGVGRYDFDLGTMPAYAQLGVTYTGDQWNDLQVADRVKIDAYTLVAFAAGIQRNSWSLDLFIDNLTDERAAIDHFDPGWGATFDTRTIPNRPRTIGLRFGQSF